MATDIAFSLGVMALLGSRVPLALKVFLTALAIVDDLGAVLSIALFYTETIHFTWLLIAGGTFLLLLIFNRLGIRSVGVYLVIGIIGLWLPLLLSGLHATLAGVFLAFTIPARKKLNTKKFTSQIKSLIDHYQMDPVSGREKYVFLTGDQLETIEEMKETCEKAESPLQRMEHQLRYPAIYFIMPLFALANTGVALSGGGDQNLFSQPVSLGILAGLVLGKSFGITFFTWIAVRLGLVGLPQGVTFRHILGVGFLAGIGFTMSLFITDLAFHASALEELAKKAIFLASLLSGIVGYVILRSRKGI